ncbi:MAG TPA: MarR family transcriptional regulator [Egibacteraceae bacterium]|nr:MarR family transcriptional regulator [Egibacteraceae bacterium]
MATRPRAPSGTALRHRLVEAFAVFGPAYARWVQSRLRDGEITYARMRLLATLRRDSPQTMGCLSDRLCVTPRNVTALVDGLEVEGLVRRRPHPTDRRAIYVELTEQGTAVCARLYRQHVEAVSALFAELPEPSQRELLGLVERLLAALEHDGIVDRRAVPPTR